MFHRRKSYRATRVTDECILSDLSLYINIQITMLHPVSFWIQIQELKWIWTSISKAQPSVPLPTQEGNLSWNLCQILPVLSVIQVCSLCSSSWSGSGEWALSDREPEWDGHSHSSEWRSVFSQRSPDHWALLAQPRSHIYLSTKVIFSFD